MRKLIPVVYNSGMFLKVVLSSLLIVTLSSLGAAYYFYQKNAASLSYDPTAAAREEVTDLIAEVGALIVLPEGETPTIATVSDPERLKDQPFFAKAKAGDKVLLYSSAKKAYLYDPVAKKLLEVAPLNIGSDAIRDSTD